MCITFDIDVSAIKDAGVGVGVAGVVGGEGGDAVGDYVDRVVVGAGPEGYGGAVEEAGVRVGVAGAVGGEGGDGIGNYVDRIVV